MRVMFFLLVLCTFLSLSSQRQKIASISTNEKTNNNITNHYVALTLSTALEDFAINLLRNLEYHITENDEISTLKVNAMALSPGGCNFLAAEVWTTAAWLECTDAPKTELVKEEVSSDVTYKSKEYLANVRKKIDIFISVMQSVPVGSVILFTDVDVVLLNDPFKGDWIRKELNLSSSSGLWFMDGALASTCSKFKNKTLVNTGYFYVKVTQKTLSLFQQAKAELQNGNTYDGKQQEKKKKINVQCVYP